MVRFPSGETANLFRGQFGKALYRRNMALYERLFAPVRTSGVPSGLHDPPRPFVFRVRHLDGAAVDRFFVGLNLFETSQPEIGALGDAIAELARQNLRAELTSVAGQDILHLPLTPPGPANRVRVHFLSPAELKPAGEPDFGRLFSRVRDRIATLRTLYGAGPLEIDFRAMGERARAVKMTRCDIHHQRIRRATGPKHPLGGFLGEADYEGDLTEFIPYLNIAQYTGVGRQTVWGKGEISIETF